MEFTIVQQKILKVPGASGIVKQDQSFYVVGDDSPYLFRLNNDFEIVRQYPIHSPADVSEDGSIPKKDKPDFEALELISANELILFGSGSRSPQQNVFKRILLGDDIEVQEYDLTAFYEKLKKIEVMQDSELNIEAVAYSNKVLYLFNRRKNVIFYVNYHDFIDSVENGLSLPEIAFSEFSLPEIRGIEAGFSGATVTRDQSSILITGSVEDTDNAYDDGEVLGSFIGMASLENNRVSEQITWTGVDHPRPLKVESIAIDQETSERDIKVVLVTDSDGDRSFILKGSLEW